ncbi:MAG: DUF1269 domain-containing protein [Acidobacteria bacterium]|nr:DUF1269 domain-containing protein [Acidobacteriota bacterium]
MSELIVIGYKQLHHASEVLNELRRQDWDWVADLDHAVVVRRDEKDRLRVDLSVDPMTREDAVWATLWGTLLSVILAETVSHGMGEAAGSLTNIFSPESRSNSGPDVPAIGLNWWIEEICIPPQFIRSAGAIIEPGYSALLMQIQTDDPIPVLKKLRSYGGTQLRTSLNVEQDEKLRNALAGKFKT